MPRFAKPIRKALNRLPFRRATAALIRGNAARDDRRWFDAIAAYRSHLDRRPRAFGIWVQLGHALKESGQHVAAGDAYDRALQLDPHDADLLLNRGHLAKLLGDIPAAAEAYRESHRLSGSPDAARELAALPAAAPHAPEPAARARTPLPVLRRGRNVGSVDTVVGAEVSGWAVDADEPARTAEVEFRHGDTIIGRTTCRRQRHDVALTGIAPPMCGFEATLALDRHDKTIYTVHAYLRATGEELQHSPFETTGYSPLDTDANGDAVTNARVAVARQLRRKPGAETVLFVCHAPDGVLKPHVIRLLEALHASGIAVLLIAAVDRPLRMTDEQLALVAGAIARENVGYDFGAWAHALRLYPEVYDSSILYVLNDSIFGPNRQDAFDAMITRIRAGAADMYGLTESHESGWHVQSFLMAFKQTLLSSFTFQSFMGGIVNLPGKQSVIDAYETRLASIVEASGFRVEALFRSNDPRNATMFAWRELIDNGMPFVKTLLFREKSFLFDVTNWQTDLADLGFDVALLESSLLHRFVTGMVQPNFPLLAMPEDRRAITRPLKVAFYGPWNYDNGLAAASRNTIAALRTAGVSLNLIPIRKPFHVHKPIVPPYDVRDFEGPADVAIIHLNPDSWSLLTEDQRAEIATARKRIGYWVWEMGHLPTGWREEFDSVDRIWAPSTYCARLFDAQNRAPVDVVPHAVPLPSPAALSDATRQAAREALGLPGDSRIILFIFDGSSYLARKNPHALLRAFDASGLAARGWRLVLKTKHLMDRAADGHELETLAGAIPGVLLIDRALPHDALQELLALADIYASPHCSEGFGLTIAEAMAAGKPVVATDFGGSTDFLDARCGYPVPASEYTLEQDFGHYTAGGVWGQIDEPALAGALVRAAEACALEDATIPEAARRRIGETLSFEAVGAAIARSLAQVMADAPPLSAGDDPVATSLRRGAPLATAALGDDMVALVLEEGSYRLRDADLLARVAARPDRWGMFVQADAVVSPDFRTIFSAFSRRRPDVAIFYADDLAVGEPSLRRQLRLKPDHDATLFAAQDYIGTPLIVRGSALHALGGLRTALGEGALTDLVARAQAAGLAVARIPEVLVALPDKRPAVPLAIRRAALVESATLAEYDLLPGLTDDTIQLARHFDAATMPTVTLLVPTRRGTAADGTVYVQRLLDSLDGTDWPPDRLRVLIGDDVAGVPEWATRSRRFAVERIETLRTADAPFNYAAKMNVLWRAAGTEHIVMVNDDVQITQASWLKALMTFAVKEDVGAVGPLLLYENGAIQHAGVAGGLFGFCAHAWLYRRTLAGTYQDWALTHREWSMITGAVVATRRSVMTAIDGFDERFSLEFNDLDLCLRMRTAGLRVIYTPHARLTHAEKGSRGSTIPPAADLALFLRRWKTWLEHDPAFHPHMHRNSFDLTPEVQPDAWFID